ncbi:complement C1q tumor necrosis factor-related protein 3-like [Mya arenaria]|uniref:complement C1q tumor necrosis factor-related protein 3-like n=1 Tax=Mya arenaria TaxID=6604 RepID=UPI0022E2B330|nr:complement C1q tumor necrosis factor-related protein 3-like [Mya arenaria]
MPARTMLVLTFTLMTLTRSCLGLLEEANQQTVDSLALDVQQLMERVERLENERNTGAVAFTAYLSNTLATVGPHQHIVFDNVITNVGGGYNALQGHFTAPIRGVYVFHVVITDTPTHAASVQLLHNGKWIGHVLADDVGNAYQTSSTVASVQLEKGDQVWVQNEYAFSGTESIDGGSWSSFVGYLVKAN